MLAHRQQVRICEKPRHKAVRRTRVQLRRLPHARDSTRAHDRDAIRQRQGLLLIMGDVHDRCTQLTVDTTDLLLHFEAQRTVERPQRLVHQDHLGVIRERSTEGHTLLLAAGELARIAALQAVQVQQLEHLAHAPLTLSAPHASELQAIADVLCDGHVRKQRIVLEDHPHAPSRRRQSRYVKAAQQHLPRRRRLEARDHLQQRRLARAAGPQQRQQLALAHLQADLLQGGRLAVGLAQPLDVEHRVRAHRDPRRASRAASAIARLVPTISSVAIAVMTGSRP